jgi:hypothetical protein
MADIIEAVLSIDGERRLINIYSQVPREETSPPGNVSLFPGTIKGDDK